MSLDMFLFLEKWWLRFGGFGEFSLKSLNREHQNGSWWVMFLILCFMIVMGIDEFSEMLKFIDIAYSWGISLLKNWRSCLFHHEYLSIIIILFQELSYPMSKAKKKIKQHELEIEELKDSINALKAEKHDISGMNWKYDIWMNIWRYDFFFGFL